MDDPNQCAAQRDHDVPPSRLANPAVTFIETQMGADFHPSLADPRPRYVPELGQFADAEQISREKIYENVAWERDRFVEMLNAYKSKERLAAKDRWDIPSEDDWNAVFKVVEKAQNDYEIGAVEGTGGAIRNCFRKLTEAGPSFVTWLSLFPEGSYASVVCGAIRLVVLAAVRTKELREEVFNAVGDIPEIICSANFQFDEYRSEKLHEAIASLYKTILETLEGILQWYSQRSSGHPLRAIKNGFGAITKGPAYGKEIVIGISRVRKAAEAVKMEAARCMEKRIGYIKQNQEFLQEISQMAQTLSQGDQLLEQNDQVLSVLNAVQKQLFDRWRDQDAIWEHDRQVQLEYNKRQDEMLQLAYQEIAALKSATTPIGVRRYGITWQRLLELMRITPQRADQDLQLVIREGRHFNLSDQEVATGLMESRRFKTWLTSPSSQNLVVVGNCGDATISPGSLVSAMLLESLLSVEAVLSVHIFCGLHTNQAIDPATNAAIPIACWMVKSLIAQLLLQHQFDLEFIGPIDQQALDQNDLGAHCKVFQDLVCRLPPNLALFCIIDGISFYETFERKSDTIIAITAILDLVELVNNIRGVFKLMIVSPGNSECVHGVWPEDVLRLTGSGMGECQGIDTLGFNEKPRVLVREFETQMAGDDQCDYEMWE
ncbi:hypothetical protein GP486_000594 [Trichoglossum hirsutum]|uniref:DUF7708 domain-containing protein n=1 Tax=Trichoglossum hirsutum TaxID=265104 RepID=A0A9P8LIM8_9PEZI|nr:hypothetical protein GP486_000594 [Trichoglossum hirsutum]